MIDLGKMGFFSRKYSMKINMSGCVEMSKAAKLLSIYCKAQTAHPFPTLRNRNPAMALLRCCFVVLFLNLPVENTKRKIKAAADTNLIPANKNGGSSWTRILLNK